MSNVIHGALDMLTETPEFGVAIIEAQMLDNPAYAMYDGQYWSTTHEQEAIKSAEMAISLPELNREKLMLFSEAYLDDQQTPGLFAECWHSSAAQRHCSDEMHFFLSMMLEEDLQISAQPQKTRQPAA